MRINRRYEYGVRIVTKTQVSGHPDAFPHLVRSGSPILFSAFTSVLYSTPYYLFVSHLLPYDDKAPPRDLMSHQMT